MENSLPGKLLNIWGVANKGKTKSGQ